jgi:hypothetical protein
MEIKSLLLLSLPAARSLSAMPFMTCPMSRRNLGFDAAWDG